MEKNPIVIQKISNHPKYPNINRFVVIRNFKLETDYEQMVFDAHIDYVDENGEKETTFLSEIEDWVVNNSTSTTVRNKDGSKRENPSYDENIPDSEPFLKMPSFRYFYLTVTSEDVENSAPLVTLMRHHIILNDTEIQFFDKCKLGARR